MRSTPGTRRHRRFLAAVLLLGATGCSGGPPPAPEPVAPEPQAPQQEPTPAARPAAGPGRTAAPAPLPTRLPNGITVLLRPERVGGMAQLQLGILAGTDFGAAGLAELAAELVLRGSDATTGRRSLQQVVAEQGGTVAVEAGPQATWINLRLPQHRWNQVLAALRDALAAPPTSRNQIERIREDFVLERIRAISADPLAETARAFLLGYGGPGEYVAALLDRDPSEVSLFVSRLYRPDSAVLALQVPGTQANALQQLGDGLGKWPIPAGAREVVPIEERRLRPGIHWAPGEPGQPCRATLLLPLPDVDAPMAAERFVLHACLTLDGVGGRLEQLQREHGLGWIRWQAEVVRLAEVPAMALHAEVTPYDAVALWRIAETARRSLLDVPPTPSELELALRRAVLTTRLLCEGAAARGRTEAALALRGLPPDTIERRLAALAAPRAFSSEAAALVYLKQPAAMVVIGGRPPEAGDDIEPFELLPPGALARITTPDPVRQAEAAGPWLERAMTAVGGAELLRGLVGYEAKAHLRSEGAPEADDELDWNARTGELRRDRVVLGVRIETRLGGDTAAEKSGDTTMSLTPNEAGMLRREARRHPLALLAAAARGDLRFRPVAQRAVGDRHLMILEVLGDEFDRLRVHIDTVSHLIRAVEVWEMTRDGSYVHLRDAWSDYRRSGAARAPFRRVTELDDGKSRVETVYSEWRGRFSAQ